MAGSKKSTEATKNNQAYRPVRQRHKTRQVREKYEEMRRIEKKSIERKRSNTLKNK